MIEGAEFVGAAQALGYGFFTGVPCSLLTPLVNHVIGDSRTRYLGAVNEGDAVAVASGAWLAGHKAVVMFQNSGLGNAVNPLSSLNHPFQIPLLLIATWRGQPGRPDEPQHALMGRITHGLLAQLEIPAWPLPRASAEIGPALAAVDEELTRSQRPFALVMQSGDVAPAKLIPDKPVIRTPGRRIGDADSPGPSIELRRIAAIEAVIEAAPGAAAFIATTGKTGRELFQLCDRPQHFYMVGSMGCALGIGLGVAMHSERPVIILDGDGASLMRLGTWATVGQEQPDKLIHVLLDNGVHDSTGGQPSSAQTVDFCAVALACGYRSAQSCRTAAQLRQAIARASSEPGPHLLHVDIVPGSVAQLGRPTVTPHEVARRFREFLAEGPVSP